MSTLSWADRNVLWHGYPQSPHAHPIYPWWRRDLGPTVPPGAHGVRLPSQINESSEVWMRSDRLRVVVRDEGESTPLDARVVLELAEVDRQQPLPPPPPLCGQIWLWMDNGRICAHTEILSLRDNILEVSGSQKYARERWPPNQEMVLVSGPLAPWASTAHKPGRTPGCERCERSGGQCMRCQNSPDLVEQMKKERPDHA